MHHGRYQDVLRKLLAKDPAERFADAAALLQALDTLPKASVEAEATLIQPLAIPLSLKPTGDDLAGLTPVSIDIPSGPAQPQSRTTPVPPTVKPTPQTSISEQRKGPVFALAAVAVAVALALGGAGYWWLSGDGEADAKVPVVSAPPASAPPTVAPPVKPVSYTHLTLPTILLV